MKQICVLAKEPWANVIVSRIRPDIKQEIEVCESIPETVNNNQIFIVDDQATYNKLLFLTVNELNIINYIDFRETTFDTPLSYYDESCNYDTLLLGMSHSQCGLVLHKFNKSIFSLSRPSMDLFCHLYYLKRAKGLLGERTTDIKNVILEIPYYIFNYDLSRFGDFIYTKLKYFETIEDYHHYGLSDKQRIKIDQYRLFVELFGENEPKYNDPSLSIVKKVCLALGVGRLIDLYKVIRNSDKVWSRDYPTTIDENTEIFREISEYIDKNFPNACFTVLVMPFNPLFRSTHKKDIEKQKKHFYSILDSSNVNVIDHFDLLNRISLFSDHCHLNKFGALEYSEFLNKRIL